MSSVHYDSYLATLQPQPTHLLPLSTCDYLLSMYPASFNCFLYLQSNSSEGAEEDGGEEESEEEDGNEEEVNREEGDGAQAEGDEEEGDVEGTRGAPEVEQPVTLSTEASAPQVGVDEEVVDVEGLDVESFDVEEVVELDVGGSARTSGRGPLPKSPSTTGASPGAVIKPLSATREALGKQPTSTTGAVKTTTTAVTGVANTPPTATNFVSTGQTSTNRLGLQ